MQTYAPQLIQNLQSPHQQRASTAQDAFKNQQQIFNLYKFNSALTSKTRQTPHEQSLHTTPALVKFSRSAIFQLKFLLLVACFIAICTSSITNNNSSSTAGVAIAGFCGRCSPLGIPTIVFVNSYVSTPKTCAASVFDTSNGTINANVTATSACKFEDGRFFTLGIGTCSLNKFYLFNCTNSTTTTTTATTTTTNTTKNSTNTNTMVLSYVEISKTEFLRLEALRIIPNCTAEANKQFVTCDNMPVLPGPYIALGVGVLLILFACTVGIVLTVKKKINERITAQKTNK